MADITRWLEHMKFMFEWKQYFTSDRSERLKSFFDKIKFICSSQRATYFLLHRYECFENFTVSKILQCPKQRNDVFTSEDMENMSFVSRM